MSYICTICNKTFTTNGGLKRHQLTKKTLCSITNTITKDRKFQCIHCNRCFTTNQSLKSHSLKSCKILKNKEKIDNTQLEIEELKNTVNELKLIVNNKKLSEPKTINNNTNCNNTINITNHIHINSFLDTNIIKEHILNAQLKEYSAAAEYAKLPEKEKRKLENAEKNNKLISLKLLEIADNVYSDPSNKNAYLYKKNIAKVYDGSDWKIKSLEMVNRELFKIIIEAIDKIKFNVSIPRSMLKYDIQGEQIKETLNTLPQMYWNNISEILKNSEFGLSVLLEANKEDIERIQKEILENAIKDNIEQDI
jgi:hypothetical protein